MGDFAPGTLDVLSEVTKGKDIKEPKLILTVSSSKNTGSREFLQKQW